MNERIIKRREFVKKSINNPRKVAEEISFKAFIMTKAETLSEQVDILSELLYISPRQIRDDYLSADSENTTPDNQ